MFVIKIPTEWQYSNVGAGQKEESPFSFIPYENPEDIGAFQISCYPATDKTPKLQIQKADTQNLKFVEHRMDGDGFNMHLWYSRTEDHFFMAKYIYDTKKQDTDLIKGELSKAVESLSKLIFISEPKRKLAIRLDRYEKFQASLAASFDLKYKAIKSKTFIEFIIIVANQIDAYLRLSIVMKEQLSSHTDDFELKYFYQGEDDKAIMERRIYKIAEDQNIISNEMFDELELLYKKRNVIVHRYVISEIRTRDLQNIAYEYNEISERIRVIMRELEDLQFTNKIGIYKNTSNYEEKNDEQELKLFFSRVNDKHLSKRFKRVIS